MIRIAIIKYAGLSSAGTEKFLQNIAVHLPKDRFIVDFFYCVHNRDEPEMFSVPEKSNEVEDYLNHHNVNLIEFNVAARDLNSPCHNWIDTDFWKVFDEAKYDIIQTGRGGYPEYPFNKIKKTPIVDSIHLSGFFDNQFNISRVMHISEWSAKKWITDGGDKNRIRHVSHIIDIPSNELSGDNYREELNLEGKFIFGFHQRNDEYIFSDIPLNAFAKLKHSNAAFIILGGSEKYRVQAKRLKLNEVYFLDHTSNKEVVRKFLRTLNVYAHGRKDGEVNSTAIAEAMFFSLPIISHSSIVAQGHMKLIESIGFLANDSDDYYLGLTRMLNDVNFYKSCSRKSKEFFEKNYSPKGQINKIIDIYDEVIINPFPKKLRRHFFALKTKKYIAIRYFEIFRYKIFSRVKKLLRNND